MFFRRFFLIMPLALFASCGLAEDPRDDEDRNTYIEDRIPDPAFRAFCMASYDLNGDGRLSLYEARRILDMSCPGLGIASLQGISFFERLKTLDCSGNKLTLLDLAVNRSLERLDCRANSLVSLYIDRLDLLQWLDCSSNALSVLALPGGQLSYIVAGKNDLRTLDISNCALNISRLETLGNPYLTVIYKTAAQRIDTLLIDGHTQLLAR